MTEWDQLPVVDHELQVLHGLVPLNRQKVIELGCGEAQLARELLRRYPQCEVTALEVDERQHRKNLATPQHGLNFVRAGAQSVPFPNQSFALALMLKSLHHVPLALIPNALAEVARVLKPGGYLYVSEPVYGGAFNDVLKLFHDEGHVRQVAQSALDHLAGSDGPLREVGHRFFATSSYFRNFDEFERRLVNVTYADHALDPDTLAKVRQAFATHVQGDGATFMRPMHVRLFQRH